MTTQPQQNIMTADEGLLLPSDLNSGKGRRSSRFSSDSRAHSETPERSSRSTPTTSLQDTPQNEIQTFENESPVPQRNLRQRKSAAPKNVLDPVETAMKPLTEEERRSWKGWVELESDPVSVLRLLSLDHEL
jgi:ubiquitin carboxyl-terminal hydrolase L5